MSLIRLLLAASAMVAAAACAQLPWESPPTPVAPPNEVRAEPATNTGGTYPYGALPETDSGTVDSGQGGATATGPNGSIWLKPGTSNARYRGDADDCYSYAHAQIAHDARMESDADAAITNATGNITSTNLRRQMSQFARDRRLPRLFGECMEAKGYTRG